MALCRGHEGVIFGQVADRKSQFRHFHLKVDVVLEALYRNLVDQTRLHDRCL